MTQEVNELVGIDTESAKKLQYHDALLQNWKKKTDLQDILIETDCRYRSRLKSFYNKQ